MLKRLSIVAATSFLALAACEGDTETVPSTPGPGNGGTPGVDAGGTPDAGSSPDVAAPEDSGPAGGKPDSFGGLPDASRYQPSQPVTRSAACDPPHPGDFGAKVPWRGFEYESKTYTCNRCPGGDEFVQGEWRVVHGETEDPETPLSDDYKEVLTFDGNVWRQHASGIDLGKPVDAWIEGWYFCGDKSEVADQQKVFVVTSVVPEGAFGFTSGIVFTGKTFGGGAGDQLLFNYFVDFNSGANYNDVYCRVGKTVKNLEGDAKFCADPFDE